MGVFRSHGRIRVALFLLAILGLPLLLTQRVHAATFIVTNTNDTGAGSLRQAITDANATANDRFGERTNYLWCICNR